MLSGSPLGSGNHPVVIQTFSSGEKLALFGVSESVKRLHRAVGAGCVAHLDNARFRRRCAIDNEIGNGSRSGAPFGWDGDWRSFGKIKNVTGTRTVGESPHNVVYPIS